VQTLVENVAAWLVGDGPEAGVAVACQCTLVRNLADFVFPARCSDEEKRSIEQRVNAVLAGLGLFESGSYCSLADLEADQVRFLAERRLIPAELVTASGPRGAYISADQGTTIAVNGSDHLCLTMTGSGLQIQDLWTQVNLLDDNIGRSLDYAFSERFGYLTASLGHTGTGLKVSAILHLPALTLSNRVQGLVASARARGQAVYGFKPTLSGTASGSSAQASDLDLEETASEEGGYAGRAFYSDLSGATYGDIGEAYGDLYLLTNLATLGASEEEIVFRLRQGATGIIAQEKKARDALRREKPRQLEDQVARALGLARNVRLLGFDEGVSLLSALRLGVTTGLIEGYSLQDANELLLASQAAHIRMRIGPDCDEWALSAARADLFRARFSQEV